MGVGSGGLNSLSPILFGAQCLIFFSVYIRSITWTYLGRETGNEMSCHSKKINGITPGDSSKTIFWLPVVNMFHF